MCANISEIKMTENAWNQFYHVFRPILILSTVKWHTHTIHI